MGDGLVNSSTLSSGDSSVVDDRHRTPTTIVRRIDATLAVGMSLTRVVNDLSLLKRDLRGNQFCDVKSVQSVSRTYQRRP